MKAQRKHSLVLITVLAAIVQPTFADPPPNVVVSDVNANTAMGTSALGELTDGIANTAAGYFALGGNTTGSDNTAFGTFALANNTTGRRNVAIGGSALFGNTVGRDNTAIGLLALLGNSSGVGNTATGYLALQNNTSGSNNTAQGTRSLQSNNTGIRNVAIGYSALHDNTTGSNNTALGWAAGERTKGNDNVLIANRGAENESQTMRLGTRGSDGVLGSGVTRTFIAGIRGVTTSRPGVPILIDSTGQLGTISSSRRFKQDIEAMADASDRLLQLRPVKFYYKEADTLGERPIQYGLIAEEVAEIFPELVILDENGQAETVAYHLLSTLLLNEVQKERKIVEEQAETISMLQAELAKLNERIDRLETGS